MKTLIADDEFANRELLKHFLRPYGDCFLAEDGATAVALFKSHLASGKPFDLVMMDIMMPNMDGQEAVREMRRLEKELYGPSADSSRFSLIIMQTSLDDPKHLVESYFKGKCNGYLTKPITQEVLLDKLQKHNLI
ncbi:MAG: response regulator [Magnetococcales bacterium]|nr:response regulator [Magnetococcales bacterium]MBF0116148.1 response regulator [Magnetococcales bacterium]